MIETQTQLEEWFYGLKLANDTNPLAMQAWSDALESPTKGKIRKFFVLALLEDDITWSAI